MFKISRKLVWLGALYMIPTVIGVFWGNKIFDNIWKKVFLYLTKSTSYIARNTSTVSVSITSK